LECVGACWSVLECTCEACLLHICNMIQTQVCAHAYIRTHEDELISDMQQVSAHSTQPALTHRRTLTCLIHMCAMSHSCGLTHIQIHIRAYTHTYTHAHLTCSSAVLPTRSLRTGNSADRRIRCNCCLDANSLVGILKNQPTIKCTI